MIEIRWLNFLRIRSVHRTWSLSDILTERTVCIHLGRYNHSTFESVNVTKHAYIDHRQSWLSPWLPGTKVVRSTGGRIRNYYSPAVSGWEKERAGLRRMHHREQIPLPRLYFTMVVRYTRAACKIRASERERERELLFSPDPHVAAVSPLNCRSINIPRLNPQPLCSVLSSLAFYFVLSLRLPLTSSSLV